MTEELRRLLKENFVDATVEAGGKIYRIEPQVSVNFKNGTFETRVEAFKVFCGDKETSCGSFEGLLKLLTGKGGEQIKIVAAGNFESYAEYLADEQFKKIDMAGLLEKYLPIADEFSLTTTFNSYDEGHPCGIFKVGESQAAEAAKGIGEYAKNSALSAYKRLTDGQKREIPPFEELYAAIKEEYRLYASARAEVMEKHGGSVFFGDEFSRGNAKYSKYEGLRGAYYAVDFEGACLFNLEKMKKNTKIRPDDWELALEYYAPLKSSLKRIETGFAWHCTALAQLSKTMYFELNGGSISWLKGLKNDYDMRRLEDLAFYRSGKCVFSSCTHEQFHRDFSAEK